MGRIRQRLTYANVISTICLFLLLGGGAFAVASSDRTQDIKIAKKVATHLIAKATPRLQSRVALGTGSLISAVSSTTELTHAAITVPRGQHFVQLQGSANFYGASSASSYAVSITGDQDCSGTKLSRGGGYLDSNADQSVTSTQTVVAATRGRHIYRLCGASNQSATVVNQVLIARTVEAGSTGGKTLFRAP